MYSWAVVWAVGMTAGLGVGCVVWWWGIFTRYVHNIACHVKTLKSYRETNISHKAWWMYRVKIPHHHTHTSHPAQQQPSRPMAWATGPMQVFFNGLETVPNR